MRSARLGSRAVIAAASLASSASSGAALTRGAACRSASALPASGRAQPPATSWVSSAVRAKPPISAAAPVRWARRASTSRAFGYGRARLGVQVVAVVPEHHQAEPGDRGEHRGPGARHHPDQAAAHRQPAPVALGRAEVRGEADVIQAGLGQGRVHAVQVAGVRHDDDHAAARGGRGGGGDGDLGGPFGLGPGSADQAARTGRPSARPARNAAPAG